MDMQLINDLTGFDSVNLGMIAMWVVVAVMFYLAVVKEFEPLLLVPIAFGAFLANLPCENMWNAPVEAADGHTLAGGLYYYIMQGIHLELFPPIIFLGVGALTDFGPLIANPRTLLLGGAAQFGVAATYFTAYYAMGFTEGESATIGIIGGADGPTTILLAGKLAPHLLGAVAVAAYSYMALVPMIQPPIMNALTTHAEKRIRMKSLRPVGRAEKLIS